MSAFLIFTPARRVAQVAGRLALDKTRHALVIPQPSFTIPVFNNFHSSSVLYKSEKSGHRLSRECEDRTREVLMDARQLKSLYTAPTFSTNISQIFDFFPLSPDKVERILLDYPEVLEYDATKVIEYIKILVDFGDYDIITQEEALLFIARCPEILKVTEHKFKRQVSEMFGLTALHDIPWNMVIIASPLTLTMSPRQLAYIVEHMVVHLGIERIRDVIGSNPNIFEQDWSEIEKKINFLQKTMNVSAYRISMTPLSLTHDLEFLQLRYQFLNKSGHYRHPDPSAISTRPAEAGPALHLIVDTDDQRFVHKCCPGLTMEEFNTFKSHIFMENYEHLEDEIDDVDEDECDDDINSNSYTRFTKGTTKSRKKRVFRAKS